MGKILLNIFILYLVWQFIKMFFAVKTVQKGFSEQINDLNQRVNNQQNASESKKNKKDDEGEYVDFEEVK